MRFFAFCIVLVAIVAAFRVVLPSASEKVPKAAEMTPSLSSSRPPKTAAPLAEFNREQKLAIAAAVTAQVAGLEDNCPRYRLREAAMYKELSASGLSEADYTSAAMNSLREQLISVALTNRASNPSQFCMSAWAEYGPNGSYRRQLLEEKP